MAHIIKGFSKGLESDYVRVDSAGDNKRTAQKAMDQIEKLQTSRCNLTFFALDYYLL